MNFFTARVSDILLSYHPFTEYTSTRNMSHLLEIPEDAGLDKISENASPVLFEQDGFLADNEGLLADNDDVLGGSEWLKCKNKTQDGYFEDFICRLKKIKNREKHDPHKTSLARFFTDGDLKKEGSRGRNELCETTISEEVENAIVFACEYLDDSDDDIYGDTLPPQKGGTNIKNLAKYFKYQQ